MISPKERKARLRELDRQIKKNVFADYLAPLGFSEQKDRTFVRSVDHEETSTWQIINFQLGTKSFVGKFAVNLAVYNHKLFPCCEFISEEDAPNHAMASFDLRKRIGFFFIPPKTFIDRLLKRPEKRLHHSWWNFTANDAEMYETIMEIRELLGEFGMVWLNAYTCRGAFEWAKNQQSHRKRLIKEGQFSAYKGSEFKKITQPVK